GDYTGIQPPMPIPEGFNYDFWLGPAPWAPYTAGRCHFNFRWLMDYSEGYISDWGAHYYDVAQWGNGSDLTSPVLVQGTGVFPQDGLYDAAVEHHIEYTYANGVKMISSTDLPGAVRFEGTEGWVHVDAGPTGLETFPESLKQTTIAPNEIHLYDSTDHHRNFIDCVKTRRETAAPVEVGHRSAALCHLGSIAVVVGRPLKWDPEKECFPEDAEAQRLLARSMRSPWNLQAL
ncbi:MAG TPA: gfo/Idh/MocA family oxidoreductase, partial [bacterium]|nr:gfo/Idh/MocA family oxidoreductase [bacterium]